MPAHQLADRAPPKLLELRVAANQLARRAPPVLELQVPTNQLAHRACPEDQRESRASLPSLELSWRAPSRGGRPRPTEALVTVTARALAVKPDLASVCCDRCAQPAPMSWRAPSPRGRPRPTEALVTITALAMAMLASVASLGCDRRRPPAPIFVPAPPPAPAIGPSIASAPPPPAPAIVPPIASAPPPPASMHVLASAPVPALCITEGAVAWSGDTAIVREPRTRGYLADSSGDTATLAFTYRGRAHSVAAFAARDTREELGLALRAQDACNAIHVTWRIEPVSEIVVQVKRSAARDTRECTDHDVRVRPALAATPPPVGVPEWQPTASRDGGPLDERSRALGHALRASIEGDTLAVFANDRLVWRGKLPATARGLRGPAGFRTDNVDVDLAVSSLRAAHQETSCRSRSG